MREYIVPFIAAFMTSIFFFPKWIDFLTKKDVTQQVRPEGPGSHQSKKNTPTLGGVGLLFSLFAGLSVSAIFTTGFVFGGVDRWRLFCILLLVFGTGLVGFLDDWLLLSSRRSNHTGSKNQGRGLKARYKLLGQLAVGVIFLACFLPNNPDAAVLNIPNLLQIGEVQEINFGVWFIPFFLITLIATTNAVNLTDGTDGLAAGAVFIALWYFAGGFVRIPSIEKFVWCLMGSCLGFLWFNVFPAKIFMGDTGSLALGAALTGLAFMARSPFMLLWVGGLFVVEALSVILQVLYFKLTSGKRILKMSPLHHHFELSGIPESQVTVRFWIVGLFLTFSAATCYPVIAW